MNNISPFDDGITHINVYSKAKTELGRLLTNFARTPFEHTKYGHFESVEGFWYWLKLNKQFDEFRNLYGNSAKKVGKERIKEISKTEEEYCDFSEGDIEDIKEAIRCKLRQNKHILKMMLETTLPFVHYYCWFSKKNPSDYKLVDANNYPWIMEELERIRKVCLDKHYKV